MKKKFETPEIKFIYFGAKDIITTSTAMENQGKDNKEGYGGITDLGGGGIGQPPQ